MVSKTNYIERICEFIKWDEYKKIDSKVRGIYVLLLKKGKKEYSVVYIGMSTTSIRQRIITHIKSRRKVWDYFSIFKVKESISNKDIKELEGLFRYIYRKDKAGLIFNTQRRYKNFKSISTKKIDGWLK